MGIPGLTSYVNNFSSVKLGKIVGSDLEQLVIDGNAFIFYIFRHYREQCPSLFGGQYSELRKAFEEFLSVLKRNNIRPYLVFDGVDFDEAKRKTKEVRKRGTVLDVESINMGVDCKNRLKPSLTTELLVETLRAHDVQFLFVDGDADKKVAQLANYLKCPLLSNDSDFYIYQVAGGYIPLDTLEWEDGAISAQVYYAKEFITRCKFSNPDLLLGIPLLIGNDFYSAHAVILAEVAEFKMSGFGGPKRTRDVVMVLEFLAKFSSLNECVEYLEAKLSRRDPGAIDSLKKGLELMKRVYNAIPEYDRDFIEELESHTDMKTYDNSTVDPLLLALYRHGKIGLNEMESLCCRWIDLPQSPEDVHQPTSQLASRRIRVTIYAIIHCHLESLDLTENIRCFPPNYKDFQNKVIRIIPREVIPSLTFCKTFKDVCDLSVEKRRDILFQAVDCGPLTAKVNELPGYLQFAALVTRYWFTVCQPDAYELRSLLVSFLLLQKGYSSASINQHGLFRLHVLHSLAQWQEIFICLIHLNNILYEPLSSPPCISRLYDGKLIFALLKQLHDGKSTILADCPLSPDDNDKLCKMSIIVTGEPYTVGKQIAPRRRIKKKECSVTVVAKPRGKASPISAANQLSFNVSVRNKFALLSLDESSDDGDCSLSETSD